MKALTALVTLFISAAALAGAASKPEPGRIWVTGATIISPEKPDHIERGSVLIENGRIVRVERSLKAKQPAGATLVSGKGQYLIPGLIDSHVHLADVPGMVPDQEKAHEAMVSSYFRQLPRSYLYFGYTTLIDLAVSDLHVLNDFRREPLHPDLYDCGQSLPFANGYPMSFAPPEMRFKLFPNFIYDAKQAAGIPAEYKPEEHTPAADVARVKSSGGICVKTYFEPGFGRDRNLPVMGPEVLSEVRKAATANELTLMVHANGFAAQKFAVDGNVDVIAHGMWHWGDLDKKAELPDEIKGLLDRIVAKRIGYQPTIQVLFGEEAYFEPDYLGTKGMAKVVPREMLAWFATPDGQWFRKELNPTGEPDGAVVEAYENNWLRRVRQVVAYLASKDANFVFGTDTPSEPTYGNLPGLNGFLEMKQLQKAGMSPAQIFRAATISNAREFRLDSQFGTIEPGKIANLVLMKKNPLETVDAYDSITTAFVHGKPIPREGLAVGAKR